MRSIVLLLLLASATNAIAPEISITERPAAAFDQYGLLDYYLGYTLTVTNPSEKNDIQNAAFAYSLPPGHSITETGAITEKKALENTGKIQTGRIAPQSRFSRQYEIRTNKKPPFGINWSVSDNLLHLRIRNDGTERITLLRVEPSGWAPAATNTGRIEKGEILLEGSGVMPSEELEIKIASASTPDGYSLYLESPESFADNVSPEKVTTNALVSVEKQQLDGRRYAVTLYYLNPTDFTQKINELKLLKTNSTRADPKSAETAWELENPATAGPGQTIEHTITDQEGTPFYWYSVNAETPYALSVEKKSLEIRAETRKPATTGFFLLGLPARGQDIFETARTAIKSLSKYVYGRIIGQAGLPEKLI